MIPKVIHYCWFGGEPLPNLAVRCIESWKKYCPDYEIKEWNESNYDVNLCEYTKEAYENKKWAFVSDYARFWILYNYGGLYFDTDVELIKSIDDIVDIGSFMGLEEEVDFKRIERKQKLSKNKKQKLAVISGFGFSVNPGLGLAAAPGLGLYKDIIDYYNKVHFVNEKGQMDKTTIVERISSLLIQYPIKIVNDNTLLINGVYIYKKDYFCPLDYFTGMLKITKNTRSIHHYSASWQSEDEKKNVMIFVNMKRQFGSVMGRILGYVCTIPLRARMYGLKRALIPGGNECAK